MSGRPMPCHGAASNVLISYRLWRARALRDRRSPGQIDAREALEAVEILDELAGRTEELVETVEHVSTCFGGEHGMHSVKAVRGWNEARKRRADREREMAERHPVARALLRFPASQPEGGEAA